MKGYTLTRWPYKNREFWYLLGLLVLTVTIPTVCLLWFMTRAVDNERMAIRQSLTEFYQSRLSEVKPVINEFWKKKRMSLSLTGEGLSPGERFHEIVTSDVADSAVVFGRDGRLMYPFLYDRALTTIEKSKEWKSIRDDEYEKKDPTTAALHYMKIVRQSDNTDEIARALQGRIRNLIKSGKHREALKIIIDELNQDRFFWARDSNGRLIVPNVQLRALQLMDKPSLKEYQDLMRALIDRVKDYSKPGFPSAQRLFLMEKLLDLNGEISFPTRNAEFYLNEVMSSGLLFSKNSILTSIIPGNLYQVTTRDGMVTGLFTHDRIIHDTQALIDKHISLPDTILKVTLITAKLDGKPFLKLNLGREMPDWEVRLYHDGIDPFAASTEKMAGTYFWIAVLVIGGIAVLVFLIAFILLKQVRLTRLKNDFVAAVSHELKTPMASIRLFVDTLLEGRSRNEHQTREYLELIATENKRLSQLIDNFLTFTRMERGKYSFQFEEIDPAEIAQLAEETVRERYEAAGCILSLDIGNGLPPVMADKDAMVTVLLNLFDNAFKYSGDEKRISMRLLVEGSDMCFRVEDNGIGLSRYHIKKVFDRFYQVDRSLSKNTGGCGLGLSIVNYIVKAHGGSIEIESEQGMGSVFIVRLPVDTLRKKGISSK